MKMSEAEPREQSTIGKLIINKPYEEPAKRWTDPEGFDIRRFFFCQLEAAETLTWLAEADTRRTQHVCDSKDVGPILGKHTMGAVSK